MSNLTIDLVQSDIIWLDRKANHDKYERLLKERQGADLTLLPEMYDTGFTMNPEQHAQDASSGSGIRFLKSLSREIGMIGASHVVEENGEYFNRFDLVGDGDVMSSYDKRHLFRMAKEHEHYTPGQERVITGTKNWSILLQVCYDLRFPVFSRNRASQGAMDYDVVVYVANWPERRREHWLALLRARAIENQAYCIGLNRVGMDGNDISYSGDTAVFGPWGDDILRTEPGVEGVFRVELDRQALVDNRERFPAWMDGDRFEIKLR